jgi:hypothetical protein
MKLFVTFKRSLEKNGSLNIICKAVTSVAGEKYLGNIDFRKMDYYLSNK